MPLTVALRQRRQVTALLDALWIEALEGSRWARLDRRIVRTWKQIVLGILIARSTRLLALGRVLCRWRRAQSADAQSVVLGQFLKAPSTPGRRPHRLLLGACLARLQERLVRWRGRVVLVVDGTDYAKRSRTRRPRHMQYIGRVRKHHEPRGQRRPRGQTATTPGYVDVWAGVVLQGKRLLPLSRQLYSSQHPHLTSQNAVEEAVLGEGLAQLRAVGLEGVVVADSQFGRKELVIRLAQAGQAVVFRQEPDIQVWAEEEASPQILGDALAQQPWLGEGAWDRAEAGTLTGQLRALTGTIRFSRSGRRDDTQEAGVGFVQFVPHAEGVDPLTLVTTLPVGTLREAREVLGLYHWRWAAAFHAAGDGLRDDEGAGAGTLHGARLASHRAARVDGGGGLRPGAGDAGRSAFPGLSPDVSHAAKADECHRPATHPWLDRRSPQPGPPAPSPGMGPRRRLDIPWNWTHHHSTTDAPLAPRP